MFLGARIDAEANGQANDGADEDGVVFNTALVPGQGAQITVMASVAGWLDAWIDFRGDGSWAQAMDQVFAALALNAGPNVLNLVVPAAAVPNSNAWARFRFSSLSGLPYAGPAPDGEVEDYPVAIVSPESDLGDAPDSSNRWGLPMNAYPGVVATFPTVYQAGSPPYRPKHLMPLARAWLGQAVTPKPRPMSAGTLTW